MNITRKYNINEDFFSIPTNENSWVYGWIYGDGNYTDGQRCRIELSSKSEIILYKIKELMKSEHKIVQRKRYDKKYKKYRYYSYIQLYSTKLIRDINNIVYSTISDTHFSHFLRGFFEAEGHVGWGKCNGLKRGGAIRIVIAQNDIEILLFIKNKLNKNCITKGGSICKNKNTFLLEYGIKDSISLYNYMYYKHNELYLPQKKEKFEELIMRQST